MALSKRARQLRRQRKRGPIVQAPRSLENAYARILERYTSQVVESVEDEIRKTVDSLESQLVQDAIPIPIAGLISNILNRIRRIPEPIRQTRNLIARVAAQNNRDSVRQYARVSKEIPKLFARQDFGPALRQRLSDNIQLIRSIPTKYVEGIERVLQQQLRTDDDLTIQREVFRTLREDVGERADIAKRRSRNIAKDQVQKLNASINEARQTRLGVTHYFWDTVDDERVRPEHARREGQRFAWDDPPSDGHPGEPVGCRCVARPDLSTLQ